MRSLKSLIIILVLCGISQWARAVPSGPVAALRLRRSVEIKSSFLYNSPGFNASSSFFKGPSSKFELPVTRGFYQKGTQLCWVYGFLNAVESLFMVRHPGSQIELSRGTFQRMTMEDRFYRLVTGNSDYLRERGDEVDAFVLAQKGGLTAFKDYQDIFPEMESKYPAVRQAVEQGHSTTQKLAVLSQQINGIFPPAPTQTHVGQKVVTPIQLSNALLGGQAWITFAKSTDGHQGWGKHPDPDARPEAKAYFLPLGAIIVKVREALSHGIPVTYGTDQHVTMIYGAEYDENGNPTVYYIKDSYPDYFYKADAARIHANMMEVTIMQPAAIQRPL